MACLVLAVLGTVELQLSELIGYCDPSGYAENPDNWIFL
jgi:hypothetical protein